MSAPLAVLDFDGGRELDAEIAEKVMGWRRSSQYDAKGLCLLLTPPNEPDEVTRLVDFYSTDLCAAHSVLDVFAAPWWIERYRNATYECRIWRPENEGRNDYGIGTGPTLPLAICRAALASVYCYGRPTPRSEP